MFRPRVLRLEDRSIPSVYVSESFEGLSSGTTATFRPFTAEAVPVVIGTTGFAALADAIAAAADGDFVYVDSGAYESGPLSITKTLTVSGVADPGVDTVITPSEGMASLFEVTANGVLTLTDVIITGGSSGGIDLAHAVRFDGTSGGGSLVNVEFSNVSGVAVADHRGGVALDKLLVVNMGSGGVVFAGAGPLSVLRDSTIEMPSALAPVFAVEVRHGATALVSGNKIGSQTALSPSEESSRGVVVSPNAGTATRLTLIGNEVLNVGVGLDVRGTTSDTVTVTAPYNNFIGNAVGVRSNGPTVDATNGWWGGRRRSRARRASRP